ncbi:MAG: hypothetical protein WCG99_05015 [Candidatus Berkelbacteria bacterium]
MNEVDNNEPGTEARALIEDSKLKYNNLFAVVADGGRPLALHMRYGKLPIDEINDPDNEDLDSLARQERILSEEIQNVGIEPSDAGKFLVIIGSKMSEDIAPDEIEFMKNLLLKMGELHDRLIDRGLTEVEIKQ